MFEEKSAVAAELLELNKSNVEEFFETLTKSVGRFIERVIIIPLHGQKSTKDTVQQAIEFIIAYTEDQPIMPLMKFEIMIRYNTGDRIEASFSDKKETIKFLEAYR
jgi:hypothetical protein